ncbi:hypothetical protein HCK01_18130, partial [Streptomyces sp. AA8]
MLLVHDERLLSLVDDWLTGVPPGAFTDVLPLLRRTFSAYDPGVRRSLGELVRHGGPAGGSGTRRGARPAAAPLDPARADAVLPTLHLLLGLPDPSSPSSPSSSSSPSGPAVPTTPGAAR